ncbi:MAG: ABC transporter permease [Bacteroidota bacterium]
MLRNYFLVAWRNILKNKTFTGINIFGLAFSMSVCMVIILLIQYHYRFDNFHDKGDRTYRIIAFQNGKSGFLVEGYATTPKPFGEYVKERYSQVETFTNLNQHREAEIRSPHKILNADMMFADQNFFDVFSFDLKEGDEATALNEPFSMILSAEKAALLFPEGDAVGKFVEFGNFGEFKVTGVVDEPPSQTHVWFEGLVSFNSIPVLVEKELYSKGYDDWEHLWSNYNYLVLNNEQSVGEIEAAINTIADEQMKLDEDHPGYRFELQKITEIVPGKGFILGNEMHPSVPGIALLFFTLLAAIVIITASINYTNLSIARSLTRAKEVGIRKVNGAVKSQIIMQFLIESLIIAAISLVVAIPIYEFLIQSFNEIWIFNILEIELKDNLSVYLIFFVFMLVIGLMTGVGPSMFLAKVKVINTLKGSLQSATKKKRFFRFSGKKMLMSLQFALSILLLVSLFLLKSQGDFMVESDYGFDEEQVYYVELQGHQPKEIEQYFSAIPGVENISYTSHHPGVGRSSGDGFKRNEADDEAITIYNFAVDQRYVDVMGLELVAGSDFPQDFVNSGKEKFILINELAVSSLGFESPAAAIGQTVYNDEVNGVTILGVLKNYHWEPMLNPIKPLALRIIPDRYDYAYLKLSGNNAETTKRIKSTWEAYDQGRTYKGGYLSAEMDLFYQFFHDISSILSLVGFLAITITGLGFLGMVSFDLQSRIKEIGIRKVLGATFSNLVFSMAKGFIKVLAITSIIAFPLAIFLNNLWISTMAQYEEISWQNVLPALLIVVGIVAVTVLSQVWRNATNNPVQALRSE